MATEANIDRDDNFFIGEDKTLPVTVYQSDGTTLQTMTGWALSWMLRKRASDSTAIITKTTGGGTISIGGTSNSVATVTVLDTDTSTLTPGIYAHELKRTDDGSETVLAFGTVHLKRGVHR